MDFTVHSSALMIWLSRCEFLCVYTHEYVYVMKKLLEDKERASLPVGCSAYTSPESAPLFFFFLLCFFVISVGVRFASSLFFGVNLEI